MFVELPTSSFRPSRLVTAMALVLPGLCLGIFQTEAQAVEPPANVFQGLGALGTVPYSYASAVSSDGSTVVGISNNDDSQPRAFRWVSSTGILSDLGTLGGSDSSAYGVSADGSVVVGSSALLNGNQTHAFRWSSAANAMSDLGTLGGDFSSAYGVSADGSVVVGQSNLVDPTQWRAFRWTSASNALSDLGTLGGTYSSANAVSADGSVVVGESSTANDEQLHAFRWTNAANSMSDLGTLGGDNSKAYGVSVDGSVVVGESAIASGANHAFRWTEVGMSDLGTLPGDSASAAYAVSGDGKVVVGSSGGGLAEEARMVNAQAATGPTAFRWTQPTGMQSVAQWLGSANVATPSGWQLREATGVNKDGSVVVGNGTDPGGNNQAWIARVTPASADGSVPPNAPPIGGSGLIFPREFNPTLAGQRMAPTLVGGLSTLALFGAHHRPLMDSGLVNAGRCVWVTGDAGRYDQARNDRYLGEVGGCMDFLDGSVRLGLGVGGAYAAQSFTGGGHGYLNGQYGLAEVDYAAVGRPWITSLTMLYGGWDTTLNRAYANGAGQSVSSGTPKAYSWAVRARFDWRELFKVGTVSLSPFVAWTHTQAHLDGYTETGGGFPARFDAQDQSWEEARIGMVGKAPITQSMDLRITLEGAQQFAASASNVSGQVVGLYAYSFSGYRSNSTWGRAMVEVDQRFGSSVISANFNAATAGGDPTYGGSLSWKMAF